MDKIAALLLTLSLARPCAAGEALVLELSPSTAAASARPPYRIDLQNRFELGFSTSPALPPPRFSFGASAGTGGSGRASIGVGAGIDEGLPLEMSVWGGAGAVVGSVVGPLGVMAGTGLGLVTGLLIAVFVVPHNGPDPSERGARR